MFALPSRWVYVWYTSGRVQNVANSDTLRKEEAEYYRDKWSKDNEQVVRVTLENRNGDILKTYTF